MKKLIYILIFGAFLIPSITFAARTESLWSDIGGYIKTNLPTGYNVLINGVNKYLNFNTTSGSAGYGLRDNGGTIEVKNSGGAWNDVVTASTSSGLAYQVLNTNGSGIPEWTYDLGSANTRLGTIYSDYIRTKWLEVSQNVIDNSFKIGSSTNPISTNLLFANTSGDASIIFDTDATFKISTSTQITGSLTANNLWYLNGNTLGSKKTLGSIDNQDFGIITNNTERLTVLKDGNFGIGTTEPQAKLDVVGIINSKNASIDGNYYATSSTDATFHNKALTSAGGYALKQSAVGDTIVNASNGRALYFNINNSSKMVLNAAGNVGIGTTNPGQKLEVSGNALFNSSDLNVYLRGNSVGNPAISFSRYPGADLTLGAKIQYVMRSASSQESGALAFWTNPNITAGTDLTERMRIDSNGFVGIGVTSPVAKLDVKGINSTSSQRTMPFNVFNITSDYNGGDGRPYTGFGGGLSFNNESYNGTFYNSAAIYGIIGDDSVATTKGGSLAFYTASTKGAALTEKMRITESGNVGIGTTAPGGKLHITTTGDANSLVINNTSGNVLIGTTTDVTAYGGAKLQVKGGASGATTWSGRIIAGGTSNVFLMGEIDGRAVLAGHNSGLTAWADLYINPVSNANTYIGNSGLWSPSIKANSTLSVVGSNVGIGITNPNSKLQVSGSLSLPYVAKTSNYTLTADDYTVGCDGTFNITLPTAVGITGRIYNIKNTGTGIITVDADGTELIDGELTQTLDAQYDNLQIQSTGTGWIIV